MSLAITLIVLLLTAATPAGSPVGDWRGSSLCQVRPSPCNDEVFVYHISALPGRNAYRMVMNKVVAGKEETMATLDASFDPASGNLRATSYDRAHRPGYWVLTVRGAYLSGTLTTSDGVIFRRIEGDRLGLHASSSTSQ
jgi:hypothetical protein